jgi:FkbM family methyltransferase
VTLVSRAAGLVPDVVFARSLAYSFRRFDPELPHVTAAFPRGGTAVDVGAWYGPWTYWLAKRASQVHSFEPNPDVARVLEHTVASNVTVHQAAASDTNGTAVLSLPAGGKGTEGRASLEGLDDGGRTVEVKTVRLDDLGITSATLLKVDVEGHEKAALLGGAELVNRSHPLLVVELEERHGGIAPVVDLLAEWGYRGRVRVEDEWKPLDSFDLAAHQDEHLEQWGTTGLLKSTLRGKSKYVNNVIFTHPETTWDVP